MKILFLTLSVVQDINERGIYTDLMRKFRDEGHVVYIVSPTERKYNKKSYLTTTNNVSILKVWTLNFQKTNSIEKGLSMMMIEYNYLLNIRKYFEDINFDLVLYSTPPITFTKVIKYIKKKCNAKSYLLLKDIFPQNAVDLNMISSGGLLHRYFRYKEKKLYNISDHIGCMSPANVEYILKNNTNISSSQLEVNPNSIEPKNCFISESEKSHVRAKYNIPQEKIVFAYGGNLGKPQAVDFLLECLINNINRKDVFFLIVGSGTEFCKLDSWFRKFVPENAILINFLPKEDYDKLVRSCDVGLIFLDHRFTIPNYPSRLLSYMENKMPILAATDVNTDIGCLAEENGYGHWCESNDVENFNTKLNQFLDKSDRVRMGENGYKFFVKNYTVDCSYDIIMKHFK